jgi:beta-ureidopropionase
MVRDDDFPNRYFNVGFIVGPQGDIVYKRYKATQDAYEGGMLGNINPHDLWDEWIKIKGKGNVMDAIFPVVNYRGTIALAAEKLSH